MIEDDQDNDSEEIYVTDFQVQPSKNDEDFHIPGSGDDDDDDDDDKRKHHDQSSA